MSPSELRVELDRMRAAFAGILGSNTKPSPKAILDLGSVLDKAGLRHLINSEISEAHGAAKCAGGLLSAATRHAANSEDAGERARLQDDAHVQRLLSEMEPRRWADVRNEITKFVIAAEEELGKRVWPGTGPPMPPTEPQPVPQYVTMDQMAALVNRSKATVERWVSDESKDCPVPDIEGGGGRAHEWIWPNIRPWLEKVSGKRLPEVVPVWRRQH